MIDQYNIKRIILPFEISQFINLQIPYEVIVDKTVFPYNLMIRCGYDHDRNSSQMEVVGYGLIAPDGQIVIHILSENSEIKFGIKQGYFLFKHSTEGYVVDKLK